MIIRKTFTIAAASAALALGATACSNDSTPGGDAPAVSSSTTASATNTTPQQSASGSASAGASNTAGAPSAGTASQGAATTSNTATASKTAGSQTTASHAGSATTSGTATSAPTAACSTQTAAQAAQKATQTIPKFNNWDWVVHPGDNHFDRCADLSYIVIGINGTASSPNHIALYHRGTYLGTATKEAYGFYPVVTRTAGNAISVRYTYIKGNECTACASGHAVANFRWSNASQKVVMTGSVPPPQN